LQLLISTLTL